MSAIILSHPETRDPISPEDFFQQSKLFVEKQLDMLLQENTVPSQQLISAARYSLLGESKKLRPMLLLAAVRTLGGRVEKALNTACAIEMIHTYSLIHDDLPCMDDDDFRRGKPSLHKAFSEAHAVLAGDFLLTYAFEVIANDPLLTNIQKVKLIALLAKNSGAEGMIAGQVLDMEAEGKTIGREDLQEIYQYKTGALITASLEMGGIIADASKPVLQALQNFGNDIGLAFQIVDDILDVTSSVAKHGKKVSSDVTNDKMTYVKLFGIEKAKLTACKLIESGKRHLEEIPGDHHLLISLADYVTK